MSNRVAHRLETIVEAAFLASVFFLPFSIALLEIFLVISFVSWLFYKLKTNEPLCENSTVFVTTSLLIITSSISAFYSDYPVLAAKGIIKIMRYALVMLVAADTFRDRQRVKRLLIVGIFSFSLVILDALIQRVHGEDLVRHWSIHYTDRLLRLTGPYKVYGLLSAHLIGALPVVLTASWSGKKPDIPRKIAWLCLFVASIYVLYKTHSRGAWLAAFVSWIFFASLLRSKWIMVILMSTAILVPLVMPTHDLIHLDRDNKEQSLRERAHLWYRAVQVIQNRPLFGCGINTYVKNYQKFDKRKNWRVPGYYAHNGYLQLAAECGLISLALFLLLLWKGIRSGYLAFQDAERQRKFLIAGLLTGFLALLLQAGVDTTLHNLQSSVMIWLLLGLLFAVRNVARNGYRASHS